MIEISFDKIVHTSDHFDKIQAYAEQLIKQGDAFMDDTEGETVKEQRRAMIPSKNRDLSIEENLVKFKEMCEGTEEGKRWSLRAKIDYQHKNGTLRDPVIYRYVEGSHHVTGYVEFPLPHHAHANHTYVQYQVQVLPHVRSRLSYHRPPRWRHSRSPRQ